MRVQTPPLWSELSQDMEMAIELRTGDEGEAPIRIIGKLPAGESKVGGRDEVSPHTITTYLHGFQESARLGNAHIIMGAHRTYQHPLYLTFTFTPGKQVTAALISFVERFNLHITKCFNNSLNSRVQRIWR